MLHYRWAVSTPLAVFLYKNPVPVNVPFPRAPITQNSSMSDWCFLPPIPVLVVSSILTFHPLNTPRNALSIRLLRHHIAGLPPSSWPPHIGVPQAPFLHLCLLSFSPYTHFLGDPIQPRGLKYHPYADKFQMGFPSQTSPEFQLTYIHLSI